jgi:dipeptidyl aminopeptidase/acylaminoacyl peptidase
VRAFSNSELPATEPNPTPVDRGIFSQVGGWIAYADNLGTSGIWAVDPEAPGDPKDQILLSPGTGEPVGWSSDGTELLVISPEGGLIILHADETKTLLRGPLLSDEWFDAAISPDGSLVAYAATSRDGLTSKLYAIDVDSGRTTLLAEPSGVMVYQPTFSPDGTQIAYMDGGGDHSHSVWVVAADGSDPHMIVQNEVTSEGHVFGLAWSPTGDRIALGLRRLPAAGIYTFAPNGSGFTRLIRDAIAPSWSPDGSQIAYESYVMIPCPESPDTCWSEDRSGGIGVADADGSDLQRIEGVHPVGAIAWNPAG